MRGHDIEIGDDNRAYAALTFLKRDGAWQEPVLFKLDTGADISAISLQDLALLDYSFADVERLMYPHGGGSNATNETQQHFVIKLKLNHIFGQLIPKGLEFPFLCAWQRDVPLPKPSCGGCKLTGRQVGGFRSLVGNNILSCFNIQIRRDERKIHLTRV